MVVKESTSLILYIIGAIVVLCGILLPSFYHEINYFWLTIAGLLILNYAQWTWKNEKK